MTRRLEQVWVTQNVLTRGIETLGGVEISGGGYAHAPHPSGYGERQLKPRDWYETREAAVKRALDVVTAKQKSIAKQLAKLAKLKAELEGGAA